MFSWLLFCQAQKLLFRMRCLPPSACWDRLSLSLPRTGESWEKNECKNIMIQETPPRRLKVVEQLLYRLSLVSSLHADVIECPSETQSGRLDVWSSPPSHLNKPPGCTPSRDAHQICLSIPQLEETWVISQSRDPLSSPTQHLPSPLPAMTASPCESNYCNWAGM